MPKYASLINGRDEGTPLLTYAVDCGDVSIVRLLLDNGAYVSADNKEGDTALHLAVSKGSVEMVRLLLKNRANTSAITKRGRTALHLSVFVGTIEIVQLLLENGADISAQTSTSRNTALHIAVDIEDVEKSRLLLENEADVLTRNKAGSSSLDLATLPIQKTSIKNRFTNHLKLPSKFKTPKIIRLLLENMAGITAQNDENTAIHLAILEKIEEISQILCSHGGVPEFRYAVAEHSEASETV